MNVFLQRLIASNVWMPAWMAGSLVFSLSMLFSTVDFSAASLGSVQFVGLMLLTIPVTVLLTLIIATIVAFVLLDDILQWQTRRNGGPFAVGDRVVIIAGRNAGRIATVTSMGQCQSLQITIDEDEAELSGYSNHQLRRASD